jgi:Na+/phosphate symporter
MLKKIKNSFQLISYLLITYFFAKLFKTDYMAIKQKRAKIKILLTKKKKVETRYEDLKKNNVRGERTALKNEATKIKKEIKDLAPSKKIDHFTDLLSQL